MSWVRIGQILKGEMVLHKVSKRGDIMGSEPRDNSVATKQETIKHAFGGPKARQVPSERHIQLPVDVIKVFQSGWVARKMRSDGHNHNNRDEGDN